VIVTKRGRPREITDEQYRQIVEWKRLKDLAAELGVPKKTAERIRAGYQYKQVSS
jgi:transposase